MAQFRATIEGQRGIASRLGNKKSGIITKTNGWKSGVRVEGEYREQDEEDVFDVWMTGGSGGTPNQVLLGRVRIVGGNPLWEPATTVVG